MFSTSPLSMLLGLLVLLVATAVHGGCPDKVFFPRGAIGDSRSFFSAIPSLTMEMGSDNYMTIAFRYPHTTPFVFLTARHGLRISRPKIFSIMPTAELSLINPTLPAVPRV